MQTLQSGTDLAIDGWVESSDPESDPTTELPSLSRRRLIWAGLTLGTSAAVVAVLWSRITNERYSTGIGELGHAELPDGSMALLNTDTEVQLHFTHRARLVRLLRGEALFDVAPDTQRAFIAEAGNYSFEAPASSSGIPRRNAARIGALVDYARDIAIPLTRRTSHTLFATRGCTFTLRRMLDQIVELVVLEGSVEFQHEARGLLRVGEDTVVQVSAPREVRLQMKPVKTVELESKVAWLDKRIVFAGNHTLREAAAEFNRYNKVHILFEGSIGNRQIRGSFRVDQPNSFVEAIERLTHAKHQVISDYLITIQDPDAATSAGERQ